MKIGVKGYQACKEAVVEMEPGEVVLLRGQNNDGKSSFVRAISSFISNSSTAEDYINKEVGEARVIIKDNKLYEWRRKPNTASYLIDKVEEKKLNRASVAEVYPDEGFLYLKAETDRFMPQVVSEGSIMFPFNQSASAAFRIFGRFMASPKLGQIQTDLKTAIKEDEAALARIRGTVDAYETEKSKVADLLALTPPREELQAFLSRVKSWMGNQQKCDSYTQRLQSIGTKLFRLQEQEGEKVVLVQQLEALAARVDNHAELKREGHRLSQLCERLTYLKGREQDLSSRGQSLEEWVSKTSVRVSRMESAVHSVSRYDEVKSKMVQLENQLKLKNDVVTVWREKFAEFKACPLCGKEI